MNTSDYNTAAMCGGCVEVTRGSTGAKVTATIVDQCPIATNPLCTAGHLDLSVAAYTQLADQNSEGHLGDGVDNTISWKYVPCPVGSNTVRLKLKEPDNIFWNQLLVEGARYSISAVSVNGINLTQTDYNYWGDMGQAPFNIKITDVHGSVITLTLPSRQSGDIDTGVQFPVCG
jgi:expansin (peptidoglycan-binding protein)